MNFKKIGVNDLVDGFAVIKTCDKKTTQRGQLYLDMTLSDSSGTINAKLWDYKENETEVFPVNTLVKVRGQIVEFNGQEQLKLERIRKTVF